MMNQGLKQGWINKTKHGALALMGLTAVTTVVLDGVGYDGWTTEIQAERQVRVEEVSAVAIKPRVTLDEENDSYAEEKIRAARKQIDQKKYQEAMPVLQEIIIQKGNNVHVTDDPSQRYYRSKVTHIENIIIEEAGEKGLETYQLLFDGVARGLMDTPDQRRDTGSLGKVVQHYFLTNFGDDAAFILGGLLLDRGDVSGAIRYLERALTHPSPSINQDEARLRLAVAYGRFGDPSAAAKQLAKVNQPEWKKKLARGVIAEGPQIDTQKKVGDWTMALGNSERDGRMKELAGIPANSEESWPTIWNFTGYRSKTMYVPQANDLSLRENLRDGRIPSRKEIYRRWADNGWFPSARPAMVGNKILYREYNKIVCLDMMNGRVMWPRPDRMRRSYPSRPSFGRHGQSQNQPYPMTFQENLMFNNELGRQVTVIKDLAFYLEGQDRHVGFDRFYRSPNTNMGSVTLMAISIPREGSMVRSFDTGKQKNVIRRDGKWIEVDNPFYGARYVSLPVYSQGMMVIAVLEKNTSLVLYGIDFDAFVKSGHPDEWLKWKQFVCDDPAQQGVRGTPVGLVIKNQTLYVSTGMGVVASYDVISGSMNWLSLYEPIEFNQNNRMMRSYPLQESTWWTNRVLLVGNQVVVAGVDSDQLMAFNAGDGKLMWEVDKEAYTKKNSFSRRTINPVEIVGVDEGYVIAAGPRGIKYFHAVPGQEPGRDGRVPKQRALSDGERMTGLPAMTEEHLLIPVIGRDEKASIIKFDIGKVKFVARPVAKLDGKAPLGNLFTNGRYLVSVGPDQVVGLAELGQQIKIAEQDLLKNPDNPQILIRLASMRAKNNERKLAIEHYQRAYQLLGDDSDKKELGTLLFKTMLNEATTLVKEDPQQAAGLLAEAKQYQTSKEQLSEWSLLESRVNAQLGRHAAAADALLSMALSSSNQFLQSPSSPLLKQRADIQAIQRLRQLLAQHKDQPEVKDWVVTEVAERTSAFKALDPAANKSLPEAMNFSNFVRAMMGQPEAAPALLALCEYFSSRKRWEQAEVLLREGLRYQDPQWQALSLVVYAQLSEKRGMKIDAKRFWTQALKNHPEVLITLESEARDVKSMAEAALARLAISEKASEQLRLGPDDQKLKTLKKDSSPSLYPLRLEGRKDSEFLMRHVIGFNHDRSRPEIRVYNLNTGERYNKRLPKMDVILNNNPYRNFSTREAYYGETLIPGGVDRHIMLIQSNRQIMAMGLVSRTLLWENGDAGKPLEREFLRGRIEKKLRGEGEQRAIKDGYVAMLTTGLEGETEVQVYDMLDGEKKWVFRVPEDKSRAIFLHDDLLIVRHREKAAMWIIDLSTGELVDRKLNEFKDMETGRQVAKPIFHDGSLIFQTRNKGLEKRDLRTGKVHWRINARGGYSSHAQVINDQVIYVTNAKGDVSVYNLKNGKLKYRVNPMVQEVRDAALTPDGKRLYAIAKKERYGTPQLAIIDHASGKLIQLIDLKKQGRGDYYNTTSAWDMANARRYVPWAISMNPSQLNSRQTIYLYDIQTGKQIKNYIYPGDIDGNRFPHLSQQILIQNDAIIIGMQLRGLIIFNPVEKRKTDQAAQAQSQPKAPTAPDAAIESIDRSTGGSRNP